MPIDTYNVDDLLEDIHRMIDDKPPEEEDMLPSDPPDLDLHEFFPEVPVDPGPDILPPPKPAAKPKLQWEGSNWTQTQRLPRHVAKLQKNQAQAYAEWLYAQEDNPPIAPVRERPRERQDSAYEELPDYNAAPTKKKSGHGFRNFVIFLLIVAIALLGVVAFLLPVQPTAAGGDDRKAGVSTILLVGTDAGGTRTDTLMLLNVDRTNRSLSLVSIPRDTLVNGGYTVPKINSVYGANNGGQVGMDMLLTRVAECIGFRPDGYILIRLEAFETLVDTLGGVEFDVPMDMYYNDPGQDLYINLKAGKQTLSGEEALGVVRFRSGYADADLGRVQVQRAFVSELLKQAVSIKGVLKSPILLQTLLDNVDSDLSTTHYLWLAESMLVADLTNIQTATLPGTAQNIGGGSYYVLDPASVAQTVNTYCNPYRTDITAMHLNIRSN